MKNKPYPLNNVPEIKNLKDFSLYCASTYKESIAFQFEQNNEILKISFQEFWDDINALGTMLYQLKQNSMKVILIGENSYQCLLVFGLYQPVLRTAKQPNQAN